MSQVLRFTVLGKPQPAGSKRAFAVRKGGVPTGAIAVVDANAKAKSWQQEVRTAARNALDDIGPDGLLTVGALDVKMTFYCQRPKSHYGTGQNAGKLKDAAPLFPTTRPDVLKLARGTEDALTGIVWADDAQTISLLAVKLYGTPERCEIVVRQA